MSTSQTAPPEAELRPPSASTPRPAPWVALLTLAAGGVLLMLLVSDRYGYHRDELYFRVAGHHLAWGYVDQPPLVPLLARVQTEIFGDTVSALRVVSALLYGLMGVIAALLARELNGGRLAQLGAAAATAVALQVVLVGHRLSTSTVDMCAQAALVLLLMRAFRTDRPRTWLTAGAVCGVALLAKYLVLLMLASLLVALLLVGPRRVLAYRGPWLGAGLAVLISLPSTIWQAAHGFPQLDMAFGIAGTDPAAARQRLFWLQFELTGYWLGPLLVLGLIGLLLWPRWRRYRAVGVGYLVTIATLYALGVKAAYAGGWWIPLLAAGSVLTVDVTREWLSRIARPAGLTAPVVVAGLLMANAWSSAQKGLPLVPEEDLDHRVVITATEQVGWPESVAAVAAAYHALPPAERDRVAIVTGNAQEAAAIDRYGPDHQLPKTNVYSGHIGYHGWGRPPDKATMLLAVGFPADAGLFGHFDTCELVGQLGNRYHIRTYESRQKIVLCRGMRQTWTRLWPSLRRYSPSTNW